MRLCTTDPLFAWAKLPDSPSLLALRLLLDLLPDVSLLAALRRYRGKGRNDYPVHLLWRIHLTRYLLRHLTMESCLAELERNPALRRVVGIEPGQAVPEAWNMSRFLEVLGRPEHLALLEQMFGQMAGRLGQAVEGLGQDLAGDSAALSARGDPPGADPGVTPLPQPDGSRKEYKDDNGHVTKVYEWFGYKFHLLVDIQHEVVLAWKITPATGNDAQMIPVLLAQAQEALPPGRIQSLAYDKAADDEKTYGLLHHQKIKPLIQNRALWKEEPERLLPNHDADSNVVYDEAGTLYCYDRVSTTPVKHKMAFAGYEKSRGTLKYRCPARHEGWPPGACPSDKKCNGDSCYGRTVRVKCELDLRRFPPIPRATAEFERRYKGRTAVERVNARLKLFWGADDGNVTGAARFHAHMATVLLIHITMANYLAMSPRYEGKSLSPTRLSRIARQLHQAAGAG
jgi:hypothetical protein